MDDSTRSEESTTTGTSPTEPSPRTDLGWIDDYRLIRRLGSGGMGEVFEAEQTRPLRRRVALKVIKAGMDTDEVVARFQSERQALALLSHPYIARVYDAGTTSQGRPYFVMEHVPGIPIREYADQHRLPLAARLELFQQVCDGIQHAHQKGIIHRDLKSSNILIEIQDGAPRPKIIDFGIAKATHQRLTDDSLLTGLGQILGTPEFMSPEQAGLTTLDIDTRTDVYSLGVLLYELLAGARPFERTGHDESAIWNLIERIRNEEPLKPSVRFEQMGGECPEIARSRGTESSGLHRALRGDLDWIVMKALEKDRVRRYSSASEFAADIGRYLSGEPVLASPPSTAYRIRKFVGRHRVAVGAAAAVALALVAGMIGTSLMLVRAIRAERVARQEAETARRTSEFMVELFQVSDPGEARGNTVTAREILDKGADRIRRELKDQPTVRARLMGTMGSVYRGLGLYDVAKPLLRETVSMREGMKDPAELGPALNELAFTYFQAGDYPSGMEVARRALDLNREELGQDHVQTAWSCYYLALCVSRSGNIAEGESLLSAALPVFQSELGQDAISVSWCLNDLANILFMRERYAEALPLCQEALRIKHKVMGLNHPDVAMAYNNLAWAQLNLGEYDGAAKSIDFAIDIGMRTLPPSHPWLAQFLHSRADLARRRGDFASAERDILWAIDVQQTSGEVSTDLALSLWTLGAVRSELGKYELAERSFRQGMAIYERLDPDHAYLVPCLEEYAKMLDRIGRNGEAGRARERAEAIRVKTGES